MLVIRHSLGGPIIFMGRCEFLKILYKHIRDKSRILTQTAVVSYEEDENGIAVTTSNGETYRGSILVGTDGVHSTVTQLMSEKLSKEIPGISIDFQKGLFSSFFLSHQRPSKHFRADNSPHHMKPSLRNTSAFSAPPTMTRLFPFWQRMA